MRKHLLRHALWISLASFAAPLAAAQVDSDFEQEQLQNDVEGYQQAIIRDLSGDPRPRMKMAAAMLLKVESRLRQIRSENPDTSPASPQAGDFDLSETDALVRDALLKGWNDPLVLWIVVANCPATTDTCNAASVLQQLREIEPENAANWLLPTPPTHAPPFEPDELGILQQDVDMRLRAIASSTRLNTHNSDLMRLLFDAVSGTPVPDTLLQALETHEADPEVLRISMAAGIALAIAWPNTGDLRENCTARNLDGMPESRRELCIAALRKLHEHADTLLIDRLATRLLLDLLPVGENRNAIRQAQRSRTWQMEALMALQNPSDGQSEIDYVRAQIDDIKTRLRDPQANEIRFMEGRLTRAGISLVPPEGWASPDGSTTDDGALLDSR